MAKNGTATKKLRTASVTSILRSIKGSKRSRKESDKLKVGKKSHNDSVAEQPSSGAEDLATPSLFRLPAELLIQIFNQISLSDLLSLRLTSRHATNITSHGDVPREWMFQNMPSYRFQPRNGKSKREDDLQLYLFLYPPPRPFTLGYILDFNRRVNSAYLLAKEIDWFIGDYILMNPHLWPSSGSWFQAFPIELLPPEYNIVRKKMVPLLLTIQHYLESLKDDYLKNQSSHSSKKSRSKLDRAPKYQNPKHLLNTHRMFMILCWIMKRLFDPASHRARRIFVYGNPLLSDAHVRLYVIMANLRGIRTLIKEDSYKQRRKTILDYREGSTNITLSKIKFPMIGWHDIWIEPARKILLQHDMVERKQSSMVPSGNRRRTLEWTTDIAGYHGAQGRLPVGYVPVGGATPSNLVDDDTEEDEEGVPGYGY